MSWKTPTTNGSAIIKEDDMKHESLEYLKELLERKYGDLDDNSGCYLRNEHGEPEWFSVAEIVKLIDRADEEV